MNILCVAKTTFKKAFSHKRFSRKTQEPFFCLKKKYISKASKLETQNNININTKQSWLYSDISVAVAAGFVFINQSLSGTVRTFWSSSCVIALVYSILEIFSYCFFIFLFISENCYPVYCYPVYCYPDFFYPVYGEYFT